MSSVPKIPETSLSPAHRQLLEKASAISPEVIAERGYRTESSSAGLVRLGFGRYQGRPPFLVIPLRGLDGSVVGYQARPDSPRVREGKPIKYELPKGSRTPIDVPPRARPLLADPGTRLIVTEGVRKADSAVSRGLCCVALLGVWGGQHHEDFWDRVPLTGREVCIAFDSDLTSNRHVQGAALRLRQVLEPGGHGSDSSYSRRLPTGGSRGSTTSLRSGGRLTNSSGSRPMTRHSPTRRTDNPTGTSGTGRPPKGYSGPWTTGERFGSSG